MHEAVERLERLGYCEAFRPQGDGLLAVGDDQLLAPESLVVEEIVRFEGATDPSDEAVLFALRTRDGRVRGTLAAGYGTQVDPACAAAVRRLPATSAESRTGRVPR